MKNTKIFTVSGPDQNLRRLVRAATGAACGRVSATTPGKNAHMYEKPGYGFVIIARPIPEAGANEVL